MPIIDGISPAGGGWTGGTRADGTFVQGTLVVITGRDFHPTPQMDRNRVSFAGPGGTRIDVPVIWASPNEIHYIGDTFIDDSDFVPSAGSAYPVGFIAPEGIAVAANTLYIANTGQNNLKWGPGGVRYGPDDPPNNFDRPSGIATSDDGSVYVANSGLHRIERYGPALFPLGIAPWGSEGPGDGQFQFPRAVDAATIEGEAFVFVADTYNRRVVRTLADGSDFRAFAMPSGVGTIQGVAAHASGDVYCSDPSNDRVLHFDYQGNFQGEFGADELSFPLGLDVDFDGFIYVADNGNRKIKKFDPDFRLIAEFGLTISDVPMATPPLELVDPVDVAVGDDKAVWIADRRRNRIVRWIPEDAQEIWVSVPEGAVTGQLRVTTDEGSDETLFRVFQAGPVSVNDVFVTQGIEEYPLVAGKRTAVIIQMATPVVQNPPDPPELESFWGSPVTDRTEIVISLDGTELATIRTFESLGINLSGATTEAEFSLLVELPVLLLAQPGMYDFRVELERPGFVNFSRTISKSALRRRSLNIGAYILSHLRPDGTPIPDGSLPDDIFLIWLQDDTATTSWLDRSTMLSGFANFNRLFPSPHSYTDIQYLRPIPLRGLSDGVSEDEQRTILRIMELQRLGLNEGSPTYDFLIAIIDRRFTPDINGVTASDSGWESAIVTFGIDTSGNPIQDMGFVAAHEIGHQHGLVGAGPRQIPGRHSNNEFVQTSRPAWHSLLGLIIDNPRSVMFVDDTTRITDLDAFFEQSFTDEPAADYQDLFNALANPHPPPEYRREVPCDSAPDAPPRPEGSSGNLSMVGSIHRDGSVEVNYSWVGSSDSPVTPLIDSAYRIVLVGSRGKELLRWPIRVSFELLKSMTGGGTASVETEWGAFRVTAPWLNEATEVRVQFGDEVLISVSVPRGQPSIEILAPTGGEQLGVDDPLEIRWVATHPDNVPLTFRVDYSPDGGSDFRMIQNGLTARTLIFHNRAFSGSDRAVIRVQASDGFHTVSDVSRPFVVERKSPSVNIIWPRNGEVIAEGKPIRMIAVARDAEDGVLDGKMIRWSLDGRIGIGGGSERQLTTITIPTPRGELRRTIPPGEHTLTARASDSNGNLAEDTITVIVAGDRDGDGYTDEEESERGTDPNDPLDHPGNLNSRSFGQWQFTRDGRWTRFEISNLTARQATLEITVIREDGEPLRNYPVDIREAAAARAASTNSAGAFRLSFGPHSSATFELRSSAAADAEILYGYSTIRLVATRGSTTAVFLAHGWIRQQEPAESARAFEGTIVIHGGQPFTLQAALPPKHEPERERRKPTVRWIRDLGKLIHAASKGKARSALIRQPPRER